MSSIEGLVIPYAVPLILGDPIILDTLGQRAVANLICLIVMRLEFLGGNRAVAAQDRDLLRLRLWPSDNWCVWIAHYAGDDPNGNWSRGYSLQLGPPADKVGPDYCNTQVTTLVIGQLCAHVFYSSAGETFPGYEGITLAQLWPPTMFDKDTAFLTSLSDEEVLLLHEAFANDAPPPPSN
jgi:hypothetical protein